MSDVDLSILDILQYMSQKADFSSSERRGQHPKSTPNSIDITLIWLICITHESWWILGSKGTQFAYVLIELTVYFKHEVRLSLILSWSLNSKKTRFSTWKSINFRIFIYKKCLCTAIYLPSSILMIAYGKLWLIDKYITWSQFQHLRKIGVGFTKVSIT